MANIDFGAGLNTPTGDLFRDAMAKLSLRTDALVIPMPTPTPGQTVNVTLPSISLDSDGVTQRAVAGVWTGSPTIAGQWTRDGTAIPGATALTRTRVPATDDGRIVLYTETANGDPATTVRSNALVTTASTTFYATSFAGTDGTNLNGLEGWSGNGEYGLLGNDLVQTANATGRPIVHAAQGNDHEFEIVVGYPTGSRDNTNTSRTIYARYTDGNNNVGFTTQANGFRIFKRVGGTETTFTAQFGRNYQDGFMMKLRVAGNYCRAYIDGAETYESSTANGGSGYDIADVPAASAVAFAGAAAPGNNAFPYAVARAATVTLIPANALAIGTVTPLLVNDTPGRQFARLSVSTQGTIAQPQVFALTSSGQVLLSPSNVTINGPTVDTPEFSPIAEGDTPRFFIRDGAAPGVIASASKLIPVTWKAVPAEFGINLNGIAPYGAGLTPIDIVKSATLTSGGYKPIWDPAFVNNMSRSNPGAAGFAWNASDYGIGDDGWPTKVPSGQSAMLVIDTGNSPMPASFAGTYDVDFTPGFDWGFDGKGQASRDSYNLATGKAVLTFNRLSGVSPAPLITFYGMDAGLASGGASTGTISGTFPTANKVFKAHKRGEPDAAQFFTNQSIASFKNITSAAKTGRTGYYGWARFMSVGGINRDYPGNNTYSPTQKRAGANRLGQLTFQSAFAYEETLAAAIAAGTNLYINIPDMLPAAEVQSALAYLKTNVPTGMRVAVEYGNEMWNSQFGQAGALYDRAVAAGLSGQYAAITQYSREITSKIVVPMQNLGLLPTSGNTTPEDPRFIVAAAWQSALLNYGYVKACLDEGDLWRYVKLFLSAPYIGGGIGGVSIGQYREQSIFKKVDRDLAGVDNAAYLTALFAAQKTMSQIVRVQSWNPFVNGVAQYTYDKGLPRGRINVGCYEYAWQHNNLNGSERLAFTGSITGTTLTVTANGDNNANAPIRVGDVLVGTGIIAGTKVVSGPAAGGVGSYGVDTNHTTPTGSIGISSSTNLYGQAMGEQMGIGLRDPRAGVAQVEQDTWLRATGGINILFDHIGQAYNLYNAGAGSVWGMENALGNETVDYPYRSVAAERVANG